MSWEKFIEPSPTRREIFECLFKLNDSEIMVLDYVLSNPGECCESVGDALGKSRSVVQRALSRLRDSKLVARKKKNTPSNAGYMYIYEPIKDLKSYLLQMINESRNRMEELVNKEF